jgi:small subunit ribosomal protein S6
LTGANPKEGEDFVIRDYELGFILAPEVNEEQTRGILDRVEQIVTNRGGQVVRVNQWGRRRMAYPIEHHRDGYYVFVDMMAAPETVNELERSLRVSEDVLRHMIRKRDSKVVQKERETYAANAAAAAQTPPPAAETEETQEAPADEAVAEPEEAVAAPEEEAALPEGISPEEIAEVPAAIEEEA